MKKALERSPDKHAERSGRDTAAPISASLESPVLAARGLTQDAFGNRGLLSLLRSGQLQRKARVSQPGDPLEHDADRAADAVVSGEHAAHPLRSARSAEIQRMPTDDEMLANALGLGSESGRAAATTPPPDAPGTPDSPADDVAGELYGGYDLDEHTRELMESRFGESFSDVRIHTGHRAAELAESLQSRAFTVGEDVVFGEGEFAPETTEGHRLLAHELAHVVQQRQPAGPAGGEKETERDAYEAAHEVVSGGTPRVRERAEPGTVQLNGEDELASRPLPAWPEGWPSENWRNIVVDGTRVAQVFAPGQPTITVVSTSATEYGKDFSKLSVSVAVVETADYLKFTQSRWKVHVSVNQVPLPNEPPEPEPPQPEPPKPAPIPPPKPKVVPPKQPAPAPPSKLPPAPKAPPEDQPPQVEPPEAPPIALYRWQPSPADQMKRALSEDPAAAARLAPDMSDTDLQTLIPSDRNLLLWALARNPPQDNLDVPTIKRLFTNTPDRDVATLEQQLYANNNELLTALNQHAKGDDAKQFGDALMTLRLRSLLSATAAEDKPDWMNPSVLFNQTPQFGPPDASPVQWVGNTPDWAKGASIKIDPRGNWTVFTKDFAPLRIEGALDRDLRAQRDELDAARRRAQALPLPMRVPRMKQLAEQKWTGSDSEEEIIEMIEHPDDFEKKPLLESLDAATADGKPLIDVLDDVVDGENNFRLHLALSKLRMSQMSDEALTRGITEAMVLPWHDTKVNAPANFFVTRLADGRIRVKMSVLQVIDLKESEDYGSEAKKLPLDLYTGDGMVFDADTPMIIHDYDANQNVVLLARDLVGYQHKGTRKFVGDTVEVGTLVLPIATGGRAVLTAGALAWDALSAGTMVADEYRVEIRKSHPELLTMLDTAKMVIAVRGAASLARSSPQFVAKWRQAYQTWKGRRALTAFAQESTSTSKAFAALENDTEAIFAQMSKEGVPVQTGTPDSRAGINWNPFKGRSLADFLPFSKTPRVTINATFKGKADPVDFIGLEGEKGGRLWVSTDAVTHTHVDDLANQLLTGQLSSGKPVEIITGTHGNPAGYMSKEFKFVIEDFGIAPAAKNLTIHNAATMSDAELRAVLGSGHEVILGWCDSQMSRRIVEVMGLNFKNAPF